MNMKEIIGDMLNKAYEEKDLELANIVSDLLSELSVMYRCPLEWREMSKQFTREYKNNKWIMDAVYQFSYYSEDEVQ